MLLRNYYKLTEKKNHKNERFEVRMKSSDMLKTANLLLQLDSQVDCVFIYEVRNIRGYIKIYSSLYENDRNTLLEILSISWDPLKFFVVCLAIREWNLLCAL